MTLVLLEPEAGDAWSVTFYLTEGGQTLACPRFVCAWAEARAVVEMIGCARLAEQRRLGSLRGHLSSATLVGDAHDP
jgi:hypothetical protein